MPLEPSLSRYLTDRSTGEWSDRVRGNLLLFEPMEAPVAITASNLVLSMCNIVVHNEYIQCSEG